MLICPICKIELSKIDTQHLKKHSLTKDEYFSNYGLDAPFGYSKELSLKKSLTHPFKNKKRNIEQRLNISNGVKQMWKNGNVSQKQINAIGERSKKSKEDGTHFNKGKTFLWTKEQKDNLSKSLLDYYQRFPKSSYKGDNDRYNKQLIHIMKLAESVKIECNKKLLEKLSDNFLNSSLLINNRITCECKKCNQKLNYSLETFEKYNFSNDVCHFCNPRNKGYSKQEEELFVFIQNLCEDTQQRNKTILSNNKELDIFIPSKNIAIEFNGLYWHSDLYKDKKYHLNKIEECEKKGIKLIHIFEDEWVFKQKIIKSKIKYLINQNIDKIYARNCVIKELKFKEIRHFLNENHIQGDGVRTSINLGLFDLNNNLISVMTFGKLRKNLNQKHKDNYYELIRFCSDKNVIGGAGKLFSYFIKKWNPEYVISYADRRWSTHNESNLYVKIGFKLDHISTPGYFYTDFVKRYNRFGFRKPKTNLIISEAEYWEKYGYRRIWDCGNLVYVWEKK